MRIHHLNCTTMCPVGSLLMRGRTEPKEQSALVCHCLLVETPKDGLVLVDTGFGLQDVRDPHVRLSRMFMNILRPQLKEENTAIRQLEKLGFQARDVRNIVLTHLDFDHAGGLDDFPDAHVHLLAEEQQMAREQRSWLDRRRFRPQQWNTQPHWIPYAAQGEPWFGFTCVRALRGLLEEFLLIPLPGHTSGHAGIAIDVGGRWLLHCGDAYFHHDEILTPPYCPPGLRAYQTLMEQNRAQRLENQGRLRALAHQDRPVELFCAHDRAEYERLRAREVAEPTVSAPAETPRARREDVLRSQ